LIDVYTNAPNPATQRSGSGKVMDNATDLTNQLAVTKTANTETLINWRKQSRKNLRQHKEQRQQNAATNR